MMFYSNYIKSNMKFKTYNLLPFNNQMNSKSDEKITSLGTCKRVYNFNCSSGALTDGVGIGELELLWENYYNPSYKTLELPDAIILVCYHLPYWSKYLKMYLSTFVIHTADQKFYYNNILTIDKNWHEITNLKFSSRPISLNSKINGDDCLIFIPKKKE